MIKKKYHRHNDIQTEVSLDLGWVGRKREAEKIITS